jgi:hypothetical protein
MFYNLYDGKVCTFHEKLILFLLEYTKLSMFIGETNFRVEENSKASCMSVLAPWSRCLSWNQIGKIVLLHSLYYFCQWFIKYPISPILVIWWSILPVFLCIYHDSSALHFFHLKTYLGRLVHYICHPGKCTKSSMSCAREDMSWWGWLYFCVLVYSLTHMLVCCTCIHWTSTWFFVQSSVAWWCEGYLGWGNQFIQTASKQAWKVWSCVHQISV